MRLPEQPVVPNINAPEFRVRLTELLSSIHRQLNGLGDGRIAAIHSARDTIPDNTEGAPGDFVPKALPTELGTAGNKYIVHGWRKLATGWVEVQTRTGN